MKQKSHTEEHYIIIFGTRYQILFDSSIYKHDILIRGLFHWDPKNGNCINKIDFFLDNLSTALIPYIITKPVWCKEQKRIELHLTTKSGGDLRSVKSLTLSPGFLLDPGDEMELVLRIYDESEDVMECEKFDLPRPSQDKIPGFIDGMTQADKDGSILIGTRVIKP